jgi:thiamine-monophosphate kinase
MSQRPALGPGAEFDAIRSMVARLGVSATGIGDDAAVITVPRGERIVASVDSHVDGIHFRRAWLTPREIGRRATVAALSDLAAMAALPLGVLTALEVPNEWQDDMTEIAAGIGDAVDESGTRVVGGNTGRGPVLAINTCVIGHAFTPLYRSGVRSGDVVYVTGRLGGPQDAVREWLRGREASPLSRDRFVRPRARVHEARWLAAAGASAAIDLSDGLVADLQHLAVASGIRLRVDLERIPCIDGVSSREAVASGEEYELIVTSSRPFDIETFRDRFGVELTAIGHASSGDADVELLDRGERVAPPPGHDHFSS